MTKRRKHKLILEITFNKKVTDTEAVRLANTLLGDFDFHRAPVTVSGPYCDKLWVKSLRRVLAGKG